MKLSKILASFLLCCLGLSTSFAATRIIPMHLVTGPDAGKAIGIITAQDTPQGLLFIPNLTNLPAGVHGFHIHEHADCDHEGNNAGSHLDPDKTGKHLGPYDSNGHLGDLPVLVVNDKGVSELAVLAPKLNNELIKNHAIMIHVGGDNYKDEPKPLGGGGPRIACGVVY